MLVEAALPLVERLRATIDLMYVDEMSPPEARVKDASVQAVIATNLAATRTEMLTALSTQLARFPEELRGEVFLEEGRPAEAIVRRSEAYDLVICGNDGRKGIAGLFGSMSESLVRGFRKPVLLIRARPDR
jgi:nucleotide-binding universal stress UspA family protein